MVALRESEGPAYTERVAHLLDLKHKNLKVGGSWACVWVGRFAVGVQRNMHKHTQHAPRATYNASGCSEHILAANPAATRPKTRLSG